MIHALYTFIEIMLSSSESEEEAFIKVRVKICEEVCYTNEYVKKQSVICILMHFLFL